MDLLLAAFARLTCPRGQTLAEYGVIVTVIAVVVVVSAVLFGGGVSHLFGNNATHV